MPLDSFKSKYPLGALVVFENKDDNVAKFEEQLYGVIMKASFFQSDAVNYACYYEVSVVNRGDKVVSVAEQHILMEYAPV